MTAGVHGGVTFDVPDGLAIVEPEVRELAAGIAADIREHGHWQDPRPRKCSEVCIIIAPTFKAAQDAEIHERKFIGRVERLAELLCGSRSLIRVTDWNDSTPTADVLAALDGIASGLVAS